MRAYPLLIITKAALFFGGSPEEVLIKNVRNYYFYKLVENPCPRKIINKNFAII